MKVSIIVPIYNVIDYFDECVSSLVNQTYKDIEILLVDDGSNDGSENLCDVWGERDDRIVVIHKENGGTHSARNLGIEKALGDYCMFIDPDDWFDIDTVEKLVQKIEETNADAIRFNYVKEFDGVSEKTTNSLLEEKLYEGEECLEIARKTLGLIKKELKNIQNFNFLASVCFCMYKRKTIVDNEVKFTSMREIGTFSDGLFNLEFFLKAKSFYYVDEYFYHYRKTNVGSCTSNYREGFFDKNQVLLGKIKNLVEPYFDDKDFLGAYHNRIAYSVLEICLNETKRDCKSSVKRKAIKKVLKNKLYRSGVKHFKLKYLPLKWKGFYLFIKLKNAFVITKLTKIIYKLKKRG
ncbi:MAG: glycosyltransferase [Clostridia bacterium]|nr:glycosyltransferase [Clostridia bacterium]